MVLLVDQVLQGHEEDDVPGLASVSVDVEHGAVDVYWTLRRGSGRSSTHPLQA